MPSCFEGIKVKVARRSDVENYLQKYNSSEVETLHIRMVWWEVDAHPLEGRGSRSRSLQGEKLWDTMSSLKNLSVQ